MIKRLRGKTVLMTLALVCVWPLAVFLAFAWGSQATSGDQLSSRSTVDDASAAVRRAHAVLRNDANATDSDVQAAVDELSRVRQELHQVSLRIQEEEALAEESEEDEEENTATETDAAAEGDAAAETEEDAATETETDAAAEGTDQPEGAAEVPTGEQDTVVETDASEDEDDEGEADEEDEHELKPEPCDDCVLVKPSPNCPKCCVKTDACIYFRLPAIYRPDPVLKPEGVYAFDAILSIGAARGFENAAIRAMNVTRACPDCANNNCDKHKPVGDDDDDDDG